MCASWSRAIGPSARGVVLQRRAGRCGTAAGCRAAAGRARAGSRYTDADRTLVRSAMCRLECERIAHIVNSRSRAGRGAPSCTAKSGPRLVNGRASSAARPPSTRSSRRLLGFSCKHGFDGLTTNAVAAAAGVSIGSLYQYFPNKEALVAALIERHIEEMNAAMLAELARVATLPIAQAARAVIELTIRAHAIDPELHRVLTEQVPRVGRLAKLRELDEHQPPHGRGLARARAATSSRSRDPELAAFVLVVGDRGDRPSRGAALPRAPARSAPRRRGDAPRHALSRRDFARSARSSTGRRDVT